MLLHLCFIFKFIGFDLSNGMLDNYRATAAELGLDNSRMLTVQGDLLSPTVNLGYLKLISTYRMIFPKTAACEYCDSTDRSPWLGGTPASFFSANWDRTNSSVRF